MLGMAGVEIGNLVERLESVPNDTDTRFVVDCMQRGSSEPG